jgi:tRNA (guanine-N7-)-methyltransferase
VVNVLFATLCYNPDFLRELLPMALRSGLITEPILLNLTDADGVIDLATLFGNPNPTELEIGSGKGTFVLTIATANPERNFIGIEWAHAYADFAADRLRRHHRTNTRMVCAEASWWVRCHLADASIAAVHIYFPDPWPKARHHKRRLIQIPFLAEVHRILQPGGLLRLVTDHADYFAHMQEMLAAQTLLRVVPFESPIAGQIERGEGEPAEIVGTNFERKYIAEGRPFYSTAARKDA